MYIKLYFQKEITVSAVLCNMESNNLVYTGRVLVVVVMMMGQFWWWW
jgi:hypothetical protein